MRVFRSLLVALLGSLSFAHAEITSISATAEAIAREVSTNSSGDESRAFDSFPGTSGALPLQVFARLAPTTGVGAAAVAGQFADPTSLDQPNPEEFAINLSLVNTSKSGHFEASSTLVETRGVRFSAADLGSPADGTAVVVGRLFLNGALAMYAETVDRSLDGAFVRLSVTIDKISAAGVNTRVFDGSIGLLGSGADVAVEAGGTFPTSTLVLSDLSTLFDDLPAFRVLVVPSLELDYSYEATVDEEFTLRATVVMSAQTNEGDLGIGVSGLLGAPTDALVDVLAATRGATGAAKMIEALESERSSPTGVPAIPEGTRLGGLCGLFGFELWLGVLGLVALRITAASGTARSICRPHRLE